MSFTSFVRFIHKYLIFLTCCKWYFKILIFNCLWLEYRNTIDFCTLIYSIALLNLLVLIAFLQIPLDFLHDNHVFCGKKNTSWVGKSSPWYSILAGSRTPPHSFAFDFKQSQCCGYDK